MNPEVLEKYRIKRGLTAKQICERVNRTQGWYSRIKCGENQLPPRYIAPLAEIFGIKPERLARELFVADKLDSTSKVAK